MSLVPAQAQVFGAGLLALNIKVAVPEMVAVGLYGYHSRKEDLL